jgi:hypothetical protein
MALLHAWMLAFAVTVVSELGVAVPVLAPAGSLQRRIAAVCLAQLATHPAVWFIWPLFDWPRPTYLLVAETFALITETLIYRFVLERIPWSRAFAASALANGTSIVAGIVLLR